MAGSRLARKEVSAQNERDCMKRTRVTSSVVILALMSSVVLAARGVSTEAPGPALSAAAGPEDGIWSGGDVSGEHSFGDLLVPLGAVVHVRGDLIVHAAGDIRIEGDLIVDDANDSATPVTDAARVEIYAQKSLFISGNILGGIGIDHEYVPGLVSTPALEGGGGSDIILSAPDLYVTGLVQCGNGGSGGYLGAGGNGGGLTLVGAPKSTHGVSNEEAAAVPLKVTFRLGSGGYGWPGGDGGPGYWFPHESSLVASSDDRDDGGSSENYTDAEPCHDGAVGASAGVTDGGQGADSAPSPDGTQLNPNGVDGVDGGAASSPVVAAKGADGGDGADCCPNGNGVGGDGCAGGTGGTATAKRGGNGGNGGSAYQSPPGTYLGKGGKAGKGGNGGSATGGAGGKGGNGGRGESGGAAGLGGAAGTATRGAGGTQGTPGNGSPNGAPNIDGTAGTQGSGSPGGAGAMGGLCPSSPAPQ